MPIQISRVRNQSRARLGQPYGTVRSVGPVRGGTGIPVAGHPNRTISIKEKRVGLSGKQLKHPFLSTFNINKVYINNYIKITSFLFFFFFFFFFLHIYIFADSSF